MYSDPMNKVSLWDLEGNSKCKGYGKRGSKREGVSVNSGGQMLACYNAPLYYRNQI